MSNLETKYQVGVYFAIASVVLLLLSLVFPWIIDDTASFTITELIDLEVFKDSLNIYIFIGIGVIFGISLVTTALKPETFSKNNIILQGLFGILVIFFMLYTYTDSFDELYMDNKGLGIYSTILSMISLIPSTVLLYDVNK